MNIRSRKFIYLVLAGLATLTFFNRKIVVRFLSNLVRKKVSLSEHFAKVKSTLDDMGDSFKEVSVEPLSLDSNSQEYDFAKILLLLEEVNGIVKQGLDFDSTKPLERHFLCWLRQELEVEKSLFFKYLGTQRQDKAEKSNVRSRKSLLYYLRAINNSLARINHLLAKVKIKVDKS